MLKVKNVLDGLNTDNILLKYIEMYLSDDKDKVLNIFYFRTKFGRLIDSLRKMKMIHRVSHIIFAYDYIEEFGDGTYFNLDLYSFRSLKKYFDPNSILRDLNINNVNEKDYRKIVRSNRLPTSIALDFIPRQEILSYYINIDNVKDVGAEKFMAALLSEMTYHGIDELEIANRKNSLSNVLNNINNFKVVQFDKVDNENEEDCFNESNVDKRLLRNAINRYDLIYKYWYLPYIDYLKVKKVGA